MNPQTDTLPLRDIHLPDPVSWWPPAIGWWLVLALLMIILFLLPHFIRWLKHKPLRKVALQEFDYIVAQHKGSAELLAAVSAFLRRLSMSYHGRQQSASLTGNAWIEELGSLNSQASLPDSLSHLLIRGPYQKQVQFNEDEFIKLCRQWLSSLPKNAPQQTGRTDS